MNFDVIKTILPNSSYDLDNLKRKYGDKLAEKRLFGSMTKLIRILSYNDEGAIIMERKKKEKRVAGLNHIINKCKKVKRKQENKISILESKIKDINSEPDYVEEIEPVIHETKMVTIGVPNEVHETVLRELNETKKRLENLSMKLMVKEHLQLAIVETKSDQQLISDVDPSRAAMQKQNEVLLMNELNKDDGDNSIIHEMGSQTDPVQHLHSGDCLECVEYSNKVRQDRFGNEKIAIQVMSTLNKHNFMQPNKHETILLVKKAMLEIKANIKHKFSVFLSVKMIELCDLLLFAFNQMERLRQDEIENARRLLAELK